MGSDEPGSGHLKCAITELWGNRKYRRFKQHKDYLIAVMTHLDILVEPKRYDLKHNRIPTDFYFVASMVQAKDDTGYLQSPFFNDRNIAISFNSNSAVIPPALSFRFITYCLSIFDVKKYGKRNDNMLFHRSAVLTIDPSLDIHILCEDERIVVRLVHARKKVLILKDLASSICECLKSALQNISQLYIKTSSDNSDVSVGTFEMNLCCSVAEDPCLLSIEEFNKIESIWICPGHQLDHEKFVLSSWITEKETMMKCENACPVTNEEFLSEDLSALHLRRLSILYSVNEIRQLVGYLNLPYTDWDDLFTSETEPQLLKFKALCLCHEQSTLTFRNIKNAVEEGQIQNPHTLCKVMRSSSVDFDTDPEKWDMVPSDEDIDKMATLIGNKSLFLLVELGMDLKIWDKINYSQKKRDVVKLNKDILDEWRVNFCKANNVRPTMRMIAHAYKSIGKDVGFPTQGERPQSDLTDTEHKNTINDGYNFIKTIFFDGQMDRKYNNIPPESHMKTIYNLIDFRNKRNCNEQMDKERYKNIPPKSHMTLLSLGNIPYTHQIMVSGEKSN
ncbi:unnamed protein product [Mytilus edulis]|uniref:Death domain-containing protein n=1 Tax=Mytilus edulis TaxID=6550 RepID=A0A8S3VNK8_MYTED|nr:unnamed protein product [Mytilus edulis]